MRIERLFHLFSQAVVDHGGEPNLTRGAVAADDNPFWDNPKSGSRFASVTKSVFSDVHEEFRLMLVHARKKAGLTQVQLADLLLRPQSFVSKVERGERRLDVIEFFEVAEKIGFDPFIFLRALQKSGAGHLKGDSQLENRSRSKPH